MSTFTALKRNDHVSSESASKADDSFTLLSSNDRKSSFSYSLERLSQSNEFGSLTRSISFNHKGLGASVDNPSNSDIAGSLKRSSSILKDDNINLNKHKYVGIVDTFSTGALMAHLLLTRGYRVIRILSADLAPELLDMVLEGLNSNFEGTVIYNTSIENPTEALDDVINKLNNLITQKSEGFNDTIRNVVAIIAGAETGVELSDALSEKLNLRTNGTKLSEARRNKFIMGETVRAANIRAVKQIKSSNWTEIENFLNDWDPNPFKVIVKPLDSAGSDGVTLCLSKDQVQETFHFLIGRVNGLGLSNHSVLIQEYLEGEEYVIDSVSHNGVHKVIAIWEYDRRPVNGAGFVCFGQKALTADEPRCQEIIEYQKQVLTALGIVNGPAHGEIKWFKNEPCLVEVGARCHGGEGAWVAVANEAYGYNQAEATICAYLDEDAFQSIPHLPLHRLGYGYMKWIIVTDSSGVLKEINPVTLTELKSLESYRGHQFFVSSNQLVRKTVDCFSWAGYVKLNNSDKDRLYADYQWIEENEKKNLFTVTPVSV